MADPTSLEAATIVATSQELLAALTAARPGETILLKDNPEGYNLVYKGSGSAGADLADVVIASLDADKPARFTHLDLKATTDLTVRDVAFEVRSGAADSTAVEVENASRITIANASFSGPARAFLSVDAPYAGRALQVAGVDGLTLRDSVISGFTYGLGVNDSTDTRILGNSITGIQGDGMRFSEVQGVEISGNIVGDFYGANSRRTHSDFVQFWTYRTQTPTTDITIEGNLFYGSGKAPSQGIFLNNEKVATQGAAAYDFLYRDVVIRDNLMFNDAKNSIYVYGAAEVEISGNAVFNKFLPEDRKPGAVPAIQALEHVDTLLFTDNISPRLSVGAATNVTQSDNVLLDYANADSATYYANYFDELTRWTDDARFADFLAAKGVPFPGAPVVDPGPSDPVPSDPGPSDPAPTGPGGATQRIGQVGVVAIDQASATSWTRVSFAAPLDGAVVVAGPASYNGEQPVTVRVRNVTRDGFDIQIDEWDYLDGKHIRETVSWVALEAGRHELAGGVVIEAGSAQAGDAAGRVNFGAGFDGTPVVLAQAASVVAPGAVATRVSGVDARGFDVRLQEEEKADGRHAPERLDWIAVSPGKGAGVAAGVTPATVGNGGALIDYGVDQTLGGAAFLAAMQTFNGSDPATVRLASRGVGEARVFVEEEKSSDAEVNHVGEAVGWLVLTDGALLF